MYAKVFRQIFESSIAENPELRFTFMDLIVLADSDGIVDITHEAISRITNRPLDVIKRTIAELEGPDPKSRTPDHNGARLKRLDDHRDWGWLIINFDKFRGIMTDSQYREKNRLRAQRFREKHPYQPKCNPNNNVTPLASRYKNVTPASASEYKGGGTGGGEISRAQHLLLCEKELVRVEKRLEDLKSKGTVVAGGTTMWTTPQKSEMKTLRDRREELKKSLGFMA